jgi:hypothetical protein
LFIFVYFLSFGGFMRDLNFQLRNLCLNCNEDSFATQSKRLRDLDLVANQLHDLGFRGLTVNGLKPKHVYGLVEFWKKQNISAGTMKNRLSFIRWWANKIKKFDMLPATNDAFAIEDRVYVTNVSKSSHLVGSLLSSCLEPAIDSALKPAIDSGNTNLISNLASSLTANSLSFDSCLERITDISIKTSILLQAAFGLRREECLKFNPSWADRGHYIVLKGSWCKGGQQRTVSVLNQKQRDVLDKSRVVAGFGSLIPPHRTYIQQLKAYENLTHKVGLFKLHGLRHKYAQERYFLLTGWLSPSDGGLTKQSVLQSSSDVLSDQRKQTWIDSDHNARLIISQELGHHREDITALYLGR